MRFRRPWWRYAIDAAVLLLVLAALASLAFRIAMDRVPAYRAEVEALISRAVGRPAQIGAMTLHWRGFAPWLDLRGVELLDRPGGPSVMQLRQLRLGFNPLNLLRGRWLPDQVELGGLDLRVDLDEQGHWSLRGFTLGDDAPGADTWLPEAANFSRVRLFDCGLRLYDARLPQPLELRVAAADFRRHGSRYQAQAELAPPADLARHASLHADLEGELARSATWRGQWTLAIDQLAGWPWLAQALAADVQLAFADARLVLDGRLDQGRIVRIEAQGQAATLSALREGRRAAQLTQLRFDAIAEASADGGWQVQVPRLAFAGARGPWPEAGISAQVRPGTTLAVDAHAPFLRLDDLAPWLVLWRDAPAAAARLHELRGDLHEVHFLQLPPDPEDRGEPRAYHALAARLENLALPAQGEAPGFSGLSGALSADDNQGRLGLEGAPRAELPRVFAHALDPSAFSAQLSWARAGPDWRIEAPRLAFTLAGARGEGRFSLLLPQVAERSPELNLALDFGADDVPALKPYLPNTWGEHTREWLKRALQAGKIAKGRIEIAGPLDDYPFVEKPTGRYALDIDVDDAKLAFAGAWPPAEQLQAKLRFRGHGLELTSERAQLAGVAIDRIDARIADFRSAVLALDGHTRGDAARYYALLRASPVHAKLAGLLDKTEARGPAQAALHLDVPLDSEVPDVRARGTVALAGLELSVRGLDAPVREVAGEVTFGAAGVAADALSGTIYGTALAASIHPEPGVPDGVLKAQFEASADEAGGVLAAFTPDWVRRSLSGSAPFTLRLPFGGPDNGRLSASSELRGISSRLPPPLGKRAEDALPLAVKLEGGARAPLRVRVDAGDQARLALRFADSNGVGVTRGAELRLGPGDAPQAEADGFYVKGAPEEFDLGAWADFVAATDFGDAPDAAKSAKSDALALRGIDLNPAHLRLRGALLPQLHFAVQPLPGGWSAQLDGAGAQGTVSKSAEDGGRVVARLERLALEAFSSAPAEAGVKPAVAGEQEPFDPRHAPTLDLSSEQFSVGSAALGRLVLSTSRIADGQQINTLKLSGGQLELDAHGEWRRRENQSSAEFAFEAGSGELSAVLQAFGYAQTVEAKKARFEGQLAWPREPDGLALAQAQGRLELHVENGTLKSVEPGAGRVLGLLNLYALPRRLLFDFRDVVSKGMGFDHIDGSFRLGDGQATTDDLAISGPSLKMEMRGRIGLAARDYDQRVTVYPDVSTAVTVGATLLGGPVGGGIALVAQQLFGKPFNKIGRFSYHVTGSWDNPQIQKGGEETKPPEGNQG